MPFYNPDDAPNPTEWLSLGEQERIDVVRAYHEAEGIDLPNIALHANIHVIVENQLAMQHLPAVRALARLTADGVPRHDCIHAIGAVLASHMFNALKPGSKVSNTNVAARYDAELERLNKKTWHAKYGQRDDG